MKATLTNQIANLTKLHSQLEIVFKAENEAIKTKQKAMSRCILMRILLKARHTSQLYGIRIRDIAGVLLPERQTVNRTSRNGKPIPAMAFLPVV